MSALNINSPQLRSYFVGGKTPKHVSQPLAKRIEVLDHLHALGISRSGFSWSEVKYLPQLIHEDENLGGVVQGSSIDGHVLLAATDKRIIYLDTKPLFVKSEDITYDAVSALTLEWLGWRGTLTLHTRLGEFKLKISNRQSAEIFRSFVESRCLENNRMR